MNETRTLYWTWLVLLGIAIIAGLITTFRLLTEGHVLFNANDILLWTLPLGTYIYLALMSSGLAILSAIPLVFGNKKYEPIAKRLVFLSITTLLGAFVAIGLELGSVFHMIYIMISPNLTSPIWWMGAIYSVELVILIVKFWRMHVGDWYSGISKTLGVISSICAILAPLMIGAVFGITESRVTFFGPLMSIYCLLIALLSGFALFIFYSMIYHYVTGDGVPDKEAYLYNDLARGFFYVTGIVVLFTILKATIEAWSTYPEFLSYHMFEHAFGVWQIFHTEVMLGLFLPFILIAVPTVRRSSVGKLVTSALLLAGTLAMHMEILLAGQSRPLGPKAEQFPEFVHYAPSVWEWLVFVFAIVIMLLLSTLGERYLKLEAIPE
jgi:Ni/Fe-hydrogenase subunit HybB-like protein